MYRIKRWTGTHRPKDLFYDHSFTKSSYKSPDYVNLQKFNNCLENISQVNFIVGPNNSGKSRLLKKLVEAEKIDFSHEYFNTLCQEANQRARELLCFYEDVVIKQFKQQKDVIEFLNGVIECTANGYLATKQNENKTTVNSPCEEFLGKPIYKLPFSILNLGITNVIRKSLERNNLELATDFISAVNNLRAVLLEVKFPFPKEIPPSVYIPSIRTLRPAETESEAKEFNNKYKENNALNADTMIRTGQNLYLEIYEMFHKIESKEKSEAYFSWLSSNFFEGIKISIVAEDSSKTLKIKMGNEPYFPLHQLGEGIQSLIVLTYPAYFAKDPTLFFIEEPELYLHPGMQRKLLEIFISSEMEKHTFFLTTHSNHFLDMTFDYSNISVYTLKKIDITDSIQEFQIQNESNNRENSLSLLGVRTSSVFLVNTTIWVQGITDRKYIRALLNLYMKQSTNSDKKKYYENVHFAFVEYGGNNITHWFFSENIEPHLGDKQNLIWVKRLCSQGIVIDDRDNPEKNKERKNNLNQTLGDRYIELHGREIENILPLELIKQFILEKESINTYDFPEVNENTFLKQGLGVIIEDELLSQKREKNKYKDTSGTLTPYWKTELADFACKQFENKSEWGYIPEETKKLIQRLYTFISENNG